MKKAVLKIWRLPDTDSVSWVKAFDDVPFREIWHNNSYGSAGLPPGKVPTLGAIDPCNPGVVYLISVTKLFAVELETRRTLSWAHCFLDVGVGRFIHSSTDICTWVIPSATTQTHLPTCPGNLL